MAVHGLLNGTTAIPWRTSRKKLSLLERLRGCEEAWCPKGPWSREEACAAVSGTPPGSFLVLRGGELHEPSVLCVSTADQHGPVAVWDIQSTGKVFQLSGSRLSFSDLTQLLLFYSFTRDVLPVCLCLPHWVYDINENKEYPSELAAKMWLNAQCEQQPETKSNPGPSTLLCFMQNSSNGALCVINPLYLQEHGDEWLTQQAPQIPLSLKRREKRLSASRPWSGAGLYNKRTMSLENTPAATHDNSDGSPLGLVRVRSADSKPMTVAPAPASSGVALRRPSRDSPGPMSFSPASPSPPDTHHGSSVPSSPHRVSWIEDGLWQPPPRPSTLLILPSVELDSLSVSSIEEEQDPSTSGPHGSSNHRLADKVKNRFSAVGQVLGGLVCQKKRLNNRVQEMSERRGGGFAESVRTFVETFLQKNPEKDALTEFLQEVRSSLTSLREMMLDHAEMQGILDSMTDLSDAEIDTLVERSLHKVTLKPLASHLYGCIQTSRSGDGTLDRLLSNHPRLEPNTVEQLGGSEGVGVPDSTTLERIQQKWEMLHKAYSPNKKVQVLLKVCKSIYHSMSANSQQTGAVFGADDFLPCLTWVLLRSDLITLQVDTDYMMELLDPTQLQGEGGYYLTTLYASLYYVSSYKPKLAARQLSVEAQQSLNQWHRRRTLHCDRSRRSKLRRTIRRHPHPERAEDTAQRTGPVATDSCDEGDSADHEVKEKTDTGQNEESERNSGGDEEEKTESVTPAQDCNEPVTHQDTRSDSPADAQR